MLVLKQKRVLTMVLLLGGFFLYKLIGQMPIILHYWYFDISALSYLDVNYQIGMLLNTFPYVIILGVALNLTLDMSYDANGKARWIFFLIAVTFLWGYGLLVHFVFPIEDYGGFKELSVVYVRLGQVPLLLYFIGLMIYLLRDLMVSNKIKIIGLLIVVIFLLNMFVFLLHFGELTMIQRLYNHSSPFRASAINMIIDIFVSSGLAVVFILFGLILFQEKNKLPEGEIT